MFIMFLIVNKAIQETGFIKSILNKTYLKPCNFDILTSDSASVTQLQLHPWVQIITACCPGYVSGGPDH